jgi:hypothetical protein
VKSSQNRLSQVENWQALGYDDKGSKQQAHRSERFMTYLCLKIVNFEILPEKK